MPTKAEIEVDALLHAFQRACETVVVRGDSRIAVTVPVREKLRAEIRARLLAATPGDASE